MINYFTLFSLEPKYLIDIDELERKYFALQMQYHPDRSIGMSESEKMLVSMRSADINDGYKTLSDDVERANHLLEISSILVNKEKNNTYKPSQALLMEQMEFRERASDIESGMENKAELLSHMEGEFSATQKDFNNAYENKNLMEAAEAAMRLKYISKLKEELERI